jgi:hypothetical protein
MGRGVTANWGRGADNRRQPDTIALLLTVKESLEIFNIAIQLFATVHASVVVAAAHTVECVSTAYTNRDAVRARYLVVDLRKNKGTHVN